MLSVELGVVCGAARLAAVVGLYVLERRAVRILLLVPGELQQKASYMDV